MDFLSPCLHLSSPGLQAYSTMAGLCSARNDPVLCACWATTTEINPKHPGFLFIMDIQTGKPKAEILRDMYPPNLNITFLSLAMGQIKNILA